MGIITMQNTLELVGKRTIKRCKGKKPARCFVNAKDEGSENRGGCKCKKGQFFIEFGRDIIIS